MEKQDETIPEKDARSMHMSRKHLFALWGTLITVLGTSVVPKIIDVLSDRPSITDVQDLIAEQTKALTESVNKNIDRLNGHDKRLNDADKERVHEKSLGEMLRDIVRDCCTRHIPDMVHRLEAESVKVEPEALLNSIEAVRKDKDEEDATRVSPTQQKLPEFNPKWIQQKAE